MGNNDWVETTVEILLSIGLMASRSAARFARMELSPLVRSCRIIGGMPFGITSCLIGAKNKAGNTREGNQTIGFGGRLEDRQFRMARWNDLICMVGQIGAASA